MKQTAKSFLAGMAGALIVLFLFGVFSILPALDRVLGSPITCTAWMYLPVRAATQDARVIENCVNPAVMSLTVYYDEPGFIERQSATGSAFLITSDGYLVTSAHVVEGKNVTVRARDYYGEWHSAEIIGVDSELDVALLKIDISWMPHLKFSDSSLIELGETTYAFGNSLGEYENSIVKGIVSGLNRRVIDSDSMVEHVWDNLIQTDAGISSGNSGGPLVDSYGRVIGVNTATAEDSDNVAFAIPANAVNRFISKYLNQ